MTTHIDQGDLVLEVFADVTCPFTHVGLKRVIEHIASSERPIAVRVRAWPLEWVNGAGLDVPRGVSEISPSCSSAGNPRFVHSRSIDSVSSPVSSSEFSIAKRSASG